MVDQALREALDYRDHPDRLVHQVKLDNLDLRDRLVNKAHKVLLAKLGQQETQVNQVQVGHKARGDLLDKTDNPELLDLKAAREI
jgi:hypothetical protein